MKTIKPTAALAVIALNCDTVDQFLHHGSVAGQSPWFDGDDWDAVYADLRQLFDLTHSGIRAVCKHYGYSQSGLARRFGIPLRSLQNWAEGIQSGPLYIVGMMIEILESEK